MNRNCIICNVIPIGRNSTDLFAEDCTLVSGNLLHDLVSEILDKKLKKTTVHSSVICKNCLNSCEEYDEVQTKLQNIKSKLCEKFKSSLTKHNLDYGTYSVAQQSPAKGFIKIGNNTGEKVKGKKLVLPASKLQPLPPNFVINIANMNFKTATVLPSKSMPLLSPVAMSPTKITEESFSPTKANIVVTSKNLTKNTNPDLNTQNLVPLKYPPQVIISDTGNKCKIIESKTKTTTSEDNSVTTVVNTSNQMWSFNVNSLLKDYLSNVDLSHNDGETGDENDGEVDNNDDHPMEIDEDCHFAIENSTNENSEKEQPNQKSKSKNSFFEVNLLSSLDGVGQTGNEGSNKKEYVLGNLELLDNRDNEAHTIVMDGSNSSILRVVSGKKFVCSDGEISLVMPADDNESNGEDNQSDGEDNDDNGEGQDSNDESQIELQVSGDEETANAIIAAAKEEGGAFIKVESGEMYRVKSVQSKIKEEVDNTDSTQSIVVKVGDNFKCMLCFNHEEAEVISTADTIMSHVKTVHDAKIYICPLCGLIVRKRNVYTNHLATHPKKAVQMLNLEKNKMYGCNECGKRYSSRTLLNEHQNKHTGQRPYSCDVCQKSYASKYTLQAHQNTHTDRPRPYKCNQCNKSFMSSQNLNQHVKTHSGNKDFHCSICGKSFGTQHNLEVHGIVHTGQRPFACGVCSKAFARRVEVRDHMRIHTGERPFSCDTCGASFSQRSNLQTHIRATHLNDKRYQCQQCPKRFKRRRLLDYHIKAAHTGERPLLCKVCKATFVYPEHYKKHMRIHSGEKPFECEVCGKTFNSRDNRNTHRFTHSDKKPYECLVCGAGYMRKQLLYTHMTTSGHMTESIVVNQPRVAKISSLQSIPEVTQYITDDGNDVDKSSLNLVSVTEEPTLLTIHNVQSSVKEANLLDEIEPLAAAQMEIVNPSEAGMVRLVQIQLPNGNNGWVAINE